MKKILLTLLLAPLAMAAVAVPVDSIKFTVIKENPITSIKDQNRSGTCWAYSSLGFLEAELLRMGKGEHDLCESFLVYHTYMDRADKAVRTHGDVSFSQGGSFYDAIYCMKHYGLAPEGTMPFPGSLYGDSLYNFNQLDAVASAYVKAIAKSESKKISLTWKKDLSSIYEHYFGALPETFEVDGKQYTPKTYVSDCLGLNPDDYISLTSFSHQPFYEQFVIEVQDNWRWGLSYNLPLDEFMEVMDHAVRSGYTFAWGADVSEEGFGRRTSIATVPAKSASKDLSGSDAARWIGTDGKASAAIKTSAEEAVITQEMRQEGYDNWTTTDDHGMVIYGLAADQDGNEYFIVKNSWGEYGKYKGIFYASKAYVAFKTMNIVIHKDALPKAIAKKLGLK